MPKYRLQTRVWIGVDVEAPDLAGAVERMDGGSIALGVWERLPLPPGLTLEWDVHDEDYVYRVGSEGPHDLTEVGSFHNGHFSASGAEAFREAAPG